MTKEDSPSSDEIERMRKIQSAARFVDEALFPYISLARFLDRERPVVEDIEALIWGYQSGENEELSIPEVGNVLRRRISKAEQSREIFHYSATHAIKALRMVEEALPLVALRFSSRKNIIQSEQSERIAEEHLGIRLRFFRVITRFKGNRNVR